MENTQSINIVNQPLVTVGIASYRRADLLCECIDSILNQTFTNFKIVVFDDNSSDDTVEKVKKKYKDLVEFNIAPFNIFAPRNYNRIYKEVDTKYFVHISDDDLLEKTFLEKTVKVLEENIDVSFAVVKTEVFSKNNNLYMVKKSKYDYFPCSGIINSSEVLDKIFNAYSFQSLGFRTTAALYRTEFFRIYNIKNELSQKADGLLRIKLIFNAKKIAFINESLYKARIETTHFYIDNYDKKIVRSLIEANFHSAKVDFLLSNKKLFKVKLLNSDKYISKMSIFTIGRCLKSSNFEEFNIYLKQLFKLQSSMIFVYVVAPLFYTFNIFVRAIKKIKRLIDA